KQSSFPLQLRDSEQPSNPLPLQLQEPVENPPSSSPFQLAKQPSSSLPLQLQELEQPSNPLPLQLQEPVENSLSPSPAQDRLEPLSNRSAGYKNTPQTQTSSNN